MEENRKPVFWPTHCWQESSPEVQGMDSDVLRHLHAFIQDQSLPMYAMLIIRHGSLVFEHYYQGTTAHDAHMIASCTKSILSALIGIALCKDSLDVLDQTLPDFIADEDLFNLDEQKRAITLRHLLTMVSGMDNLQSGRYHCAYVQASVQAHNAGGLPEGSAYGLLWWITTLEKHAAFHASGLGGQYIFVIPDADMVVVISSTYERRSAAPQKELLTRFVLPAIVDL